MSKVKVNQLVYVIWHDASGADGWVRKKWLQENHGLAEIHTVGFIVQETKDAVTLTMCVDNTNDNAGAFMTIPTKWITHRKPLQGSKLTIETVEK